MAKIGISINQSPVVVGVSAADIADGRMKGVKFDTSGKIVICSTAGEAAAGILIVQGDKDVKAGEEVTVQIKDIGYAKAGAAIKAGDLVAVDADGTFKTAAASQFIVGMAVTEAKAAGSVFQIQLIKGGYVPGVSA